MRTLLALFLLVPAVSGQTVRYYPGGSDPTTGGGNLIPFQSTFASELRYQFGIPAAGLPSQPAMLTAVAFAPAATSTLTIPTLAVNVGHAVPGGLTCNLDANSNDFALQFQGPHSYVFTSSTWSPFGIPLSFPYDGTSGLVIELRMLNTSGGAAFMTADAGNVLRSYNRLPGSFNAALCSHSPWTGLKLELRFDLVNQPQVNPYGAGCAGANGVPTLGSTQLPSLGNPNFTLDIAQGTPNATAYLFAALAPANPSVPVGPCAIHLDAASLTQLVAIGFSPLGPISTGAAGTAVFPLPVPPDVAFLGATLWFQGAVTDLSTINGFALTNAVEVVIN